MRKHWKIAVKALLMLAGVTLGLFVCLLILAIPSGVPLIAKSRACFGTDIYVDGVCVWRVDAERTYLRLSKGRHCITARKAGFCPATISVVIEDYEQYESKAIKMYCNDESHKKTLKLFGY